MARSESGKTRKMQDDAEHNGNRRWLHPRLPRAIFDTTPPLVDAMSSLVDAAVDRVLATPHRVTTAAEGKRLLAADDSPEAVADQLQRGVVVAVPMLRTFLRGARLARVPWVLVATTAFSVGTAVRGGVRETQVIGSLIAHRLEDTTGRPADPDLVKKLTLDLYLDPRTRPDGTDLSLPLGRVLGRWLTRGAFGRDTRKAASKALDAAERLDLSPYVGL